MTDRPYAIILEEDVRVDPRKYGDIVAPILGLTRLEARIAVRRGRGIFLDGIPAEDARRIAEELARDGIRAHAVPREQLPSLPAPRKVNHLERGDELLFYLGEEGRAAVPWDAIFVASCGAVSRPESGDYFARVSFKDAPPMYRLEGRDREIVRENLILRMNAREDPPGRATPGPEGVFEAIVREHAEKVRIYFDLLTQDLGTWLRIPLEEIGYVPVAGGVRMGHAWGFQMLADDLVRKCAPALTDVTARMLAGEDVTDLVFPQAEEFMRYTSWVAIKRSLWPDAGRSPLQDGKTNDFA